MGRPLSDLCQRCGLCCDGTLFASVPLKTPEEAEAVRSLSLPVVQREDGSLAMTQPCGALQGAGCTVYAQRPATCQEYHCNLYAAVAEGEVEVYEALEVVDQAHARIAGLGVTFGYPTGAAIVPEARRRAAYDPDVTRDLREALSKVERYLDQHFRGRGR